MKAIGNEPAKMAPHNISKQVTIRLMGNIVSADTWLSRRHGTNACAGRCIDTTERVPSEHTSPIHASRTQAKVGIVIHKRP